MKNTKVSEDNKLSKLSLDELIKEEKKRSAAHLTFSIIIGLMIGVSIYATVKKGFSGTTPLPLAFIPLYLIIRSSWKNVCNEIKSRKSN